MWVTAVSSGRSPQSVQVDEGRRVLGRAPTCDVVIEDSHVSQQHAQLDVTPEGAWLADLQSTNGTFVAGDRLQRTRMAGCPLGVLRR